MTGWGGVKEFPLISFAGCDTGYALAGDFAMVFRGYHGLAEAQAITGPAVSG